MTGRSHPHRRGTTSFDKLDQVADMIAALFLMLGGTLAVGYASAFGEWLLGVGP